MFITPAGDECLSRERETNAFSAGAAARDNA